MAVPLALEIESPLHALQFIQFRVIYNVAISFKDKLIFCVARRNVIENLYVYVLDFDLKMVAVIGKFACSEYTLLAIDDTGANSYLYVFVKQRIPERHKETTMRLCIIYKKNGKNKLFSGNYVFEDTKEWTRENFTAYGHFSQLTFINQQVFNGYAETTQKVMFLAKWIALHDNRHEVDCLDENMTRSFGFLSSKRGVGGRFEQYAYNPFNQLIYSVHSKQKGLFVIAHDLVSKKIKYRAAEVKIRRTFCRAIHLFVDANGFVWLSYADITHPPSREVLDFHVFSSDLKYRSSCNFDLFSTSRAAIPPEINNASTSGSLFPSMCGGAGMFVICSSNLVTNPIMVLTKINAKVNIWVPSLAQLCAQAIAKHNLA
jgi:hypothetical protein